MGRILVVEYSRSGNTRKVAEAIASACSADLEEIRDKRSRSGIWDWLRSGREAWLGIPSEIEPPVHDPAAYDLVVLGSPVWAGHVSSPMRRYLMEHSGKFGTIALFVTMGGSGGARAFSEMTELAGKPAVATLELAQRVLRKGVETKLAGFLDRIKTASDSSRADAAEA